MDKIPTLDDMLKIYSKKDLFHRLEDKQRIINGLRQQLAEKDEEIKVIDEDRQFKAEMWTRFADKCKDLEQQLAEKEKEIESLKQGVKDTIHIYSDEFVEKDKELKELRYKVKKHNQDKISFAVERLEKVKGWIIEYSDLKGQNWDHTLNYLNNQIKQLKDMK